MNGSNGERKKIISDLLSVSVSSVEKWTKDLRKQEDEERNRRIIELWLSCCSLRDIAEKTGVNKDTVDKIVMSEIRQMSENRHEPPDSLRIYDVWQFSKCDERYGADYPGRIPGQIIELWLSCYSQEEIAKELGISQDSVSRTVITEIRKFTEIGNAPPILTYNNKTLKLKSKLKTCSRLKE